MWRAYRTVATVLRQGRFSSFAALAGVASRKYANVARSLLGSAPSGNYGSLAALLAATAGCVALSPAAMAAISDERSFIMVKPDGVHRGLVGEIIQRFERKGYKLVGIKGLVPSKDLASKHYAEHDGKPFFPKLVDFLSSGPVIAMVWEGKEVIKYGRTLIGVTNPVASAPGTIRGDFGIDVGRNIIHGSDSTESAQQEIALWFHPDELTTYQPVATPWIYE